MNQTIPTDNLLTLLEMVVTGDSFPDHPGSSKKMGGSETKYGTIESPIARRLWSALDALGTAGQKISEEHTRLHMCGKPGGHDCEEFANRMVALEARRSAIRSLAWQTMHEEHPASFRHSIGLRDGWTLVGLPNGGEILRPDSPPLSSTPPGLLGTFSARVVAIFREQQLDDAGKDIGTALGDKEKVIGEVTDPRLRALFRLGEEMRLEAIRAMPASMPFSPDTETMPDPAAFVEWMGTQNLNDIERMINLMKEFKEAGTFLQDLAWRGVRDTYPAAQAPEILGLRNDWKIVEVEPEPQSLSETLESLETLIHGRRGLIIPVGSNSLLAALLGAR